MAAQQELLSVGTEVGGDVVEESCPYAGGTVVKSVSVVVCEVLPPVGRIPSVGRAAMPELVALEFCGE